MTKQRYLLPFVRQTFALMLILFASFSMAYNVPRLRAQSPRKAEQPIVKPGKLVAVNTQKDKCFNKGPDGKLVEVKCPDVIVAKPTPSSAEADTTAGMVARKARAKEFVPRSQINKLGVKVSIGGGSYNCYEEDPPGHFTRVVCPDVIVLEPGK